MSYARAIKIIRTVSGLSQTALAERLSIGTSQLSLIEAGKRQPSLKVIHEISDVLNVPPHLITLLASGGEEPQEWSRGEGRRGIGNRTSSSAKHRRRARDAYR